MNSSINNGNEVDEGWRRLALQFDGHRMQALWHIRRLLIDPEAHKEAAEQFLSASPISGEKILADRLRQIVTEN